MTKGSPEIPRLKNRDIVRAIVRILERAERRETDITDFMRCQF